MMSTENRAWLPFAIGLSALLAALIALGVVRKIAEQPPSTSVSDEIPAAVIGDDGEALPQALWDVSVFPAGLGKPSKAQRAVVAKQRDALKQTVSSITDALVLGGDMGDVSPMMTAGVLKKLVKSKLALPDGMSEVRTVKRTAKVGVDEKAAHAAARVAVSYMGDLEGRNVKILHKMDLWLERGPKGWRVVAFSGTAGQAR